MYRRDHSNVVNGDRSRDGLRRSIDTAAEDLGESVAEDIPVTADRVRSRLPDDPEELTGESDRAVDGPLRAVLGDSPLGRYLE